MWTGRFQQATDALLRAYSESISFDWRLYPHDIAGSIAHAAALADAGLLTEEERSAIETGLRQIEGEIERGEFPFKPELEDIHMNIESALTARIGPAGAKLHTARSRNDQVALDLRLYLRAEITEIRKALRDIQRALVDLGARYPETVMPGYTHLQRAQPVLFAHHLLAYVEMFDRDSSRLADASRRLNVLPLGSGAIAGSTITLDRQLIAERLGFASLSQNSMDAVSDRDFACEFLFDAAMIGLHLSRLSEDVILWVSSEFHFLTLSDAFTTGSSLMPQKKNPDVAELTRGKSGRLYGNLLRLMTILKGLPMTYNRDLQEDKEAVFDSVDTLKSALAVFSAMLLEARAETADMARAASDPNLLATDLADYLVLKGVPFRQAHEVIGKLVALCLERRAGFAELSLEDYRALSSAFGEDVFAVLDVRRSLESRRGVGAPSFSNVAGRLKEWQEVLHAKEN
jgi:argininosuccinate lyase